jgi:hypothetical protein
VLEFQPLIQKPRLRDKRENTGELIRVQTACPYLRRRFASNHYPRKPITTFQAPSVDRLHGHLDLPFGDHDSQIAVTLGTGAWEVLGRSALSLRQAFVHHDPSPNHSASSFMLRVNR